MNSGPPPLPASGMSASWRILFYVPPARFTLGSREIWPVPERRLKYAAAAGNSQQLCSRSSRGSGEFRAAFLGSVMEVIFLRGKGWGKSNIQVLFVLKIGRPRHYVTEKIDRKVRFLRVVKDFLENSKNCEFRLSSKLIISMTNRIWVVKLHFIVIVVVASTPEITRPAYPQNKLDKLLCDLEPFTHLRFFFVL